LTQDQINISGWTSDPNNVDTDGDGMLDGIEHLFTAWNLSAETWTLNPLVAGDGDFDGDEDGLIDAQEFALASSNPENGIEHPSDAPLLHIDGDAQQATEKAQRVFNILITKETRGKRLLTDFNGWQQGEPPNAIISILLGMTDPTNPDTDGDGMYDGFEYWFTAWNLDQNRWSMNPLIDNDVNLDTDGDSFDCNGDGVISQNETFSNLREWESRTWGKYLERSSVPAALGIIDFGEDAMNAYMEETGMSLVQAKDAIYDDFVEKSQDSADEWKRSMNSTSIISIEHSLGLLIQQAMIPMAMESQMVGNTAMLSTEWKTRPPLTTGHRTQSIHGMSIMTVIKTVGMRELPLIFQPTKAHGVGECSHLPPMLYSLVLVTFLSPTGWNGTTKLDLI